MYFLCSPLDLKPLVGCRYKDAVGNDRENRSQTNETDNEEKKERDRVRLFTLKHFLDFLRWIPSKGLSTKTPPPMHRRLPVLPPKSWEANREINDESMTKQRISRLRQAEGLRSAS